MTNIFKSNTRFVYPAHPNPDLQFYVDQQDKLMWSKNEIPYDRDLDDWGKLGKNEKNFIKHVLAFFAASDGIVGENLILNMANTVQDPVVRAIYMAQANMERIHSQVYTELVKTLFDGRESENILDALHTMPIVSQKSQWAIDTIEKYHGELLNPNNKNDIQNIFAHLLVSFACVEGIQFSGSFASIFWLRDRGLMTAGLGKSNELINRDENLHRDIAIKLYNDYIPERFKIGENEIKSIVGKAVELEVKFMTESLPVNMIGMNSKMMSEYIRYVGDTLLKDLKVEPIYNATQPFDFMKTILLESKANFHETRATEYQHNFSTDFNITDL